MSRLCELFRFRFLVIPASSICRTDQKTREAFPKYFHIPVVTLNSQIKDYPFVVYNNKKVFIML